MNQVGSQAEFEAMLPIQRKALADAIGLSTADLAKFVAGEKTSMELAEERREAERGHMDQEKAFMAAQLAAMGAQLTMQALITKASLGAAVGGIYKTFSFFPLGLGLAAAATVVASMYSKAKQAPTVNDGGMKSDGTFVSSPKGTVRLNDADEAVFGTKLSSNQPSSGLDMVALSELGKNSDAQLKEAKEINKNTKKLLEQNQFLMSKLIRTTSGLRGD